MALKVDLITALSRPFTADEMIQRHFVQGRRRGVRRDMSPDIAIFTVGTYYHRHGVPAHDAFNAPLDFATPRKEGLLVSGDGIDIRRVRGERQLHAGLLGVQLQALE